jgi:hypothetical protein
MQAGAMMAYGLPELTEYLSGLELRLANPTELEAITMKVLEEGERQLFSRLSPRFEDTGATKASLTQPSAEGAIREIHGMTLRFGTSIWYAKFLRKIDGPGRKPRGRKRVGPSLVLKLKASDRRAALEMVGRYVMRGVK